MLFVDGNVDPLGLWVRLLSGCVEESVDAVVPFGLLSQRLSLAFVLFSRRIPAACIQTRLSPEVCERKGHNVHLCWWP